MCVARRGCGTAGGDDETGRDVGVVAERDVGHGGASGARRAAEITIEEIMRPASACGCIDEPIEEARRKLDTHRATSLPVVDKAGCCCGTISSHRLTET